MVETAIGDLCVVNRVFAIFGHEWVSVARLRLDLRFEPEIEGSSCSSGTWPKATDEADGDTGRRSLDFELQLSQKLRPILKQSAGRLARYTNIDVSRP